MVSGLSQRVSEDHQSYLKTTLTTFDNFGALYRALNAVQNISLSFPVEKDELFLETGGRHSATKANSFDIRSRTDAKPFGYPFRLFSCFFGIRNKFS